MTPTVLTELHKICAQHCAKDAASPNHPLSQFIATYFEHADQAELRQRGVTNLFSIANAHWRLLNAPRAANTARVRVFNPTLEEDGFTSEHTLVQIVNDNMPFLVDSVTMAINRTGRTVHWMIHPLMCASRDGNAQITHIASASASGPAATVESLILVECDRILESAPLLALAQEIERVLGDVRNAVQDWQAMLARAHAVTSATASTHGDGVEFLRWLEDGHFTFLGARDYDLVRDGDQLRLIAKPETGLGVLRGPAKTAETQIPPEAIAWIESDELVLVTKALTRSTVHRPSWLDYVAFKRLDANGQLIGETRFLGLYTASAYLASVRDIPLVRHRVAAVMQAAGVVPNSHDAKSLQTILEVYPRDELFQIDTATLITHAMGILRLQERQRTRLFLRRDPFGRFTSALVFVPRERFHTELRTKIGKELMAALDGQAIEFTPMLTDSPLARIHYLVRAATRAPKDLDTTALEQRIAQLTQAWQDDCSAELVRQLGEGRGLALAQSYANAFPTAYRESFSAAMGAQDAQTLHALSATSAMQVSLYRTWDAAPGQLRFKIFSTSKVALSDSLPLLERMGARILDEQPYAVGPHDAALWIHDLGLQVPPSVELSATKARFEALFMQTWRGALESDDLNRLVLTTTLDANDILVLRAYTRYFKQLGFAFSQNYIEATLNKNPALAQALVELFHARFAPDVAPDRSTQQDAVRARIETALAQVSSLDEDRILRQFLATILATLRTNHWQPLSNGARKPYLSLKLQSKDVPGLPEPKPHCEIWVYSPRVEGVHLRMGKVARGGLRWSDRREDFRTEVLGLVKAQQVKNTVIVPVGSKGGFVLKSAPPANEREAFLAEGIACYKLFLSGLLDLTDNIVQGATVPPSQVVRHDGDDPYLVVAADKGTATFSDIANGISADYGFWLGDAFASGGSVGYDHKKMGITARGAWEAVKRHFLALGIDTQTTPFTIAGIGDMSGDVFGNGMLLSPHIRLLLAFDHRHIFIDPNPDEAVSFSERQRLFALPRSSWDDYDKSLISHGGGVYPRSAKSIPLSAEARSVLGTDAAELAPVELIQAILRAPVDLLYNGGIGTWVKASFESHAQVGDKAGDAYRVNGNELRCKVLAEGGNLGCTQNGRIEYAQHGGLIYTDAIDNSAGVDCSDHEVNIKILLGQVVEAGDLTLKQRNALLASMTDEVAQLVLKDNHDQTQALDVATHNAVALLDAQQNLIWSLERAKRLNRAIEFLPSDEEINKRRTQGHGLTAPENAVLLAYAKMAVFDALIHSNIPDDPQFAPTLAAYFPPTLVRQFGAVLPQHPLKREIIATCLTNAVVNRMGAAFAAQDTAGILNSLSLTQTHTS